MKRIVVDADSLSRVFDKTNSEHAEYEPLYDGLFKHGNLTIAYGGKKYCTELEKASRYRKLFSELRTAGIVIPLDNVNVNLIEKNIMTRTKDTGFNDQHIIAIVIEGNCRIICSRDSEAYPFFQNKNLYPKRFKRPKIYKGLGSRSILD